MLKHVEHQPISHHFSVDRKQTYFVPKYQRKYVWGLANWESFFNDLEDSDHIHFMGSIIYKC